MRLVTTALSCALLARTSLLAENSTSLLGASITPGKGSVSLTAPLQIILLLTLLTILPAAIMSVTPFLRITVVLHFLRQALGTQGTPSNQVLVGLSLFLTILIMQPVAAEMYTKGCEPMERGELTAVQAFESGTGPLKTFLLRYAREKDLKLFIEISHA